MRRPPTDEGHGRRYLIDRRAFLQLSAAAVAGGILSACAPSRRPVVAPQALRAIATEVAKRSEPGLNVFPGAGEILAGPQRLPFGLGIAADPTQKTGGQARIWVARGATAREPVAGRFQRYVRPGVGDPEGFYVALIDIPDGSGPVDVLVEHGGRYGTTVLAARAKPTVPAVGQNAISVATPTVDAKRGVATICTRDPQCALHAARLDEALRVGKPVVLTISSPKLCTSRTCGPVLEEVLQVQADAPNAATYIHVEPFASNTATTLSPAARTWRIESEPWTFVIGRDGKVLGRFEGPVVASEIAAVLPA